MELALNLVWLFLAVPGIGLLLRRLSEGAGVKRSSVSPWRIVAALAVCWLILFFVISMTDDIQELQATIEEAQSGPAQITSDVPAGKCFTHIDLAQAAVSEIFRCSFSFICISRIQPRFWSEVLLFQGSPLPDRAPPVLPLA